jgi:hypothetical protein
MYPYVIMFNCFHPIYFPIWLLQRCSRWTKKRLGDKMVAQTNVLIPWYPISYLKIASSGFFFLGRLWVPTRSSDLVVPATGCGGVLTRGQP